MQHRILIHSAQAILVLALFSLVYFRGFYKRDVCRAFLRAFFKREWQQYAALQSQRKLPRSLQLVLYALIAIWFLAALTLSIAGGI